MGRPKAEKKTLKIKTLVNAIEKAGGAEKLARRIGKTYRMLQYYRTECEAPPEIVDKIERIAAGEA